jgi:hypothetical protein
LLSILVLALPITIIGSNFSKEYDNYLHRVEFNHKKMHQKKKALKKRLITGTKTSFHHMNDSLVTTIRKTVHAKTSSFIEMIGISSPKAEAVHHEHDHHLPDIEAEQASTNEANDRRLSLKDPSESALDMPELYTQDSAVMSPQTPPGRSILEQQSSFQEEEDQDSKSNQNHNPRRQYPVARFLSNSSAWTARQSTVRFRPLPSSRGSTALKAQRSIFGSKVAYEIGTLSDIDEDEDDAISSSSASPVASGPSPSLRYRSSNRMNDDFSLAWLLALSEESLASMPRDKLMECFLALRREHENHKTSLKQELEDLLLRKCK